MTYYPRFTYTNSIVNNLGVIEAARAVINLIPLPPDTALGLRHEAFEKSTRCSVAIEGNTLDQQGIRRALADSERKATLAEQEVRNYWLALNRIEEFAETTSPLSEAAIREFHSIIIYSGRGRKPSKSDYRIQDVPVVDQASGLPCYLPPEDKEVPYLMQDLVAWLASVETRNLPAVIRAGILTYQFITIHPFTDGNGRTGRILANAELWQSGYKMRGFFSFEEYFSSNRNMYYDGLQMDLPLNYYDGRNDPDLTPWLSYFTSILAKAAISLHKKAAALYQKGPQPEAPWDELPRRQQQLLTTMLSMYMTPVSDKTEPFVVKASDIETWFGVSNRSARNWLSDWSAKGFLIPISTGEGQRVHRYQLSSNWQSVIKQAQLVLANNGS